MSETWKPVPGYEGLYEVSDQGRVRSLDRIIYHGNGQSRSKKGQILTPTMRGGYRTVALSAQGQPRKREAIHTIVLRAFVGPRPEGQFGRHLDDQRDNNTLANLAWGTPTENSQDALRNGVNPYAKKTHCPSGHPYSGDNLYVSVDGKNRKCRACKRQRDAAYYEANKDRLNAETVSHRTGREPMSHNAHEVVRWQWYARHLARRKTRQGYRMKVEDRE